MPDDLDRVIAALRFLELRPNIASYKWRFIIQKVAYLAQALGMGTSYYFTIYVAGPYSTSLAHDYYDHANQVNSLETEYVLTSEENAILRKIRACCDMFQNPILMECTSTITYLMKQFPELTDDEVFARIKSLKSYLSEYVCVIGMAKAKELLFRPEYFTEELRREIDEWDRIYE